jgi:MoaA/NifB/PqqE/SkfB family radical SAM enzyme
MYDYRSIKHVQLEITTKCNAACPQCPRNHHGGPTVKSLPITSWSLADLQHILPIDFVKQLDSVYFCGTYGDPMMNTEITDMCAWLRGVNSSLKLSLHTNGSTGSAVSYQRLANLVDFIAFGIDGLEDTNHLYRRQTRWSTIMRNATAFIRAGGAAYWDFIVFQHNEHQVESAQQLSQSMGFKKFNIKKTYRFLNRNHQLIPSLTVGTYILKPPTQEQYLNKFTKQINPVDIAIYQHTTKISCFYLAKQEIYIGADGFVFPCGWLHDRLYGVESETSPDHQTIKQMMQEAGGKDHANCFKTPLIDIVNGAWFQVIAENWKTNRLQRCAMMCGNGLNFVGDQNEHVSY